MTTEHSRLEDVVRALRSPRAYRHPAADVEVIQTHISYIFLAGEYAYKVKKPLSLGFLDYSSLERRKKMCEEEVRINQRLCDDIYLGVVAITDDGRRLSVSGAGEIVEYAVAMRRLPRARMLDEMIRTQSNRLDTIVHRVAEKIARFHLESASELGISRFGLPSCLLQNWDENIQQLAPFAEGLFTMHELDVLNRYGRRYLEDSSGLLEERVASGRIRDCHGDLRADSVYARPDGDVCILDAIEFNDRMRFGDVAGDVAFLTMDLEFRSRRDLADELLATYLSSTPDETLPLVLNYYKTYRALVRAKVEAMRSSEREVPTQSRQESLRASRGYIELALDYVREESRPVVIYMIGLSGTGKSYLANAIGCRTHAAVLSSDAVRRIALPAADERYSAEQRERVYKELRQQAARHLAARRPVILDATHLARRQRDAARSLASEHGVPVLGIWVTVDEAKVRERLAARSGTGLSPSDASWRVYEQQRIEFEPVGDDEEPILRLSTDQALTENITAALNVVDSPTTSELHGA